MERIIVHLIRGGAKEAHEAITQDLVQKFDLFPIHERVTPHLTLKRWFKIGDQEMNELCNNLDIFTASQRQSQYSLSGFGNFGEGVIYVDVVPSSEMSKFVTDLLETLSKVGGLTFEEFDSPRDFHATVAMRSLKPFDFNKIWSYLKTVPQPSFQMRFDNFAILKKIDDKLFIERVWELNP